MAPRGRPTIASVPAISPTITVCGESVVDLVPQVGGLYRALPGGSPANVAVALARLGEPTTFLGRMGADVFGRQVRDHLIANGVDTRYLVHAAEPTTLAVATLDPQGRADYDFWALGTADWQWSESDLADHPGAGVHALHAGSLASWTPPGDQAVAAMLRRAHRSDVCTVSYDPNVRPALMGSRAAAREQLEALVAHAHVVKASEDDLGWLYPGEDPAAAAARWAASGPGLVVVTLGAGGSLGARPGSASVVRRPAPQVTVVDTIGAGDTFTAGLLHGLSRLDALGPSPRSRLAGITDGGLASVLDLAGRAAAITCSRVGCDPPSAADLAGADLR